VDATTPSCAIFVTTAFASLPPNAIAITEGDEVTNSVFYLHDVEKLRPDVIHLGSHLSGGSLVHGPPAAPSSRSGLADRRLWTARLGTSSGCLMTIPSARHGHRSSRRLGPKAGKAGYRLVPYGLVHAMIRENEVPGYQEWAKRDGQAMAGYDVVPALRAPEESWENAVAQRVLGMQIARAHMCLLYSSELGNAPSPRDRRFVSLRT